MTRDYDQEIKQAENELSTTVATLEKLRYQFISATANYLREWFPDKAREIVTNKSSITVQIGKEAITKIKDEVENLQLQVNDIVEKNLQKDELWWHTSQEDWPRYKNPYSTNEIIKYVRLAAGQLAPILEKHGYLLSDLPPNTGMQPTWREWDETGNRHPPNARPMYHHDMEWPEPMKQLLEGYNKLQKQGEEQAIALKAIKKSKEQAQAEDIWDKA